MWGAPRGWKGKSLTICGCAEKPKEHPPVVKPPPAPASVTYGGHKGVERPERRKKDKAAKVEKTFRGDPAHARDAKGTE